jgi:hypothetical protein
MFLAGLVVGPHSDVPVSDSWLRGRGVAEVDRDNRRPRWPVGSLRGQLSPDTRPRLSALLLGLRHTGPQPRTAFVATQAGPRLLRRRRDRRQRPGQNAGDHCTTPSTFLIFPIDPPVS